MGAAGLHLLNGTFVMSTILAELICTDSEGDHPGCARVPLDVPLRLGHGLPLPWKSGTYAVCPTLSTPPCGPRFASKASILSPCSNTRSISS